MRTFALEPIPPPWQKRNARLARRLENETPGNARNPWACKKRVRARANSAKD
jgi:hypothetical protein